MGSIPIGRILKQKKEFIIVSTNVSIIIPVFNSEKTLNRVLDSIINQTYKNFEAVCVNDGSTDNSLNILNEYRDKYPFIKVLSQENSGPAKARNYAISQARGKYIMFCDTDDWYEPNMVEEMVSALEEQNVDIVMCDCNVIDLSAEAIHTKKSIEWCHLKYEGFVELTTLKKANINCVLWNKIFRKEIMDKYNITYPVQYEHDDRSFYWKYIFACSTYYGLNKKLYNYIVGNPESISGKYRTKEYSPHRYDFIYSLQEIFDFIKTTNIKIDYKPFFQYSINSTRFFYKNLNEDSRKEAFKLIKQLVKNNIDFIKYFNDDYIYINRIKQQKTFDDFIFNKVKKRSNPILNFIYSVEYKNFREMKTILGIIKINTKNRELEATYKIVAKK